MKRWSLALQMFFLSKRFQAHQAIIKSNSCAIQDRSIYEDAHIFARALFESGNMDERDFENYLGIYKTMLPFLAPPDLIVYIRRSVKNLKERIKERITFFGDTLKILSERFIDCIFFCFRISLECIDQALFVANFCKIPLCLHEVSRDSDRSFFHTGCEHDALLLVDVVGKNCM
jgi:hypothetical protein